VSESCSPGDKSVTPDDDTGSDGPRDGRTAQLARDADGDALGSAVFFDADDLRALGVDLADADRVRYAVENGHLVLDADGGNDGGGGDV
jgi:hypothetical protein